MNPEQSRFRAAKNLTASASGMRVNNTSDGFWDKLKRSHKVDDDAAARNAQSTSSSSPALRIPCCQWCQRPFWHAHEYEDHKRRTEPRRSGTGPWVCHPKDTPVVSAGENNTNSLAGTATTNASTVDTPTKCSFQGCGKIFINDQLAAAHKIVHSHDQRFHYLSRTHLKHLRHRSIPDEDVENLHETDEWDFEGEDARAEDLNDNSTSDNDEVGELPDRRSVGMTASIYGTSMPTHSFLGSMSNHSNPRSPLTALKEGSLGLASPRSFQTAHSSVASYSTAPSGSHPSWRSYTIRSERRTTLPLAQSSTTSEATTRSGSDDFSSFYLLVHEVVEDVMQRLSSASRMANGGLPIHYDWPHTRYQTALYAETKLQDAVQAGLSSIKETRANQFEALPPGLISQLVDRIAEMRESDINLFELQEEHQRNLLRKDITRRVLAFLETRALRQRAVVPGKVFSSVWLTHLHSKGILLDRMEELDWSGKGQHVEYGPNDAGEVPLTYERTLGHSQTAIVDSVRCRRIRLARKKIVCSRRLKKEDAIVEVEHLMRLHHVHIVRVVGTYTLKRELAILLYPAAEWDLDKFMDELWDDVSGMSTHERSFEQGTQALVTFFGCLSHTIEYIHSKNVKHMDIKPKNILVRRRKSGYRVYIADFGIARAYASAEDAQTDSPTSFTRTYAAPEVVHQDTRGFSADIFSLGCVYMEMMAVLSSCLTLDEAHDERQNLLDLRQSNPNPSFYANIPQIINWYEKITSYRASYNRNGRPDWDHGPRRLGFIGVDIIPSMLRSAPDSRPSASELKEVMTGRECLECGKGPEPFEAADSPLP